MGEVAFCPDNDNDGFDESLDCNDNNPNINPNATETCDGVDNDCDDEVDEGCQVCTDGDNDGFFAQNGCGTAVDCNDNDSTVNPNSLEVCDGVDNNCDGQTDEGCPLNCPTGTADCNGDRIDCETDIGSDPANCGGCGSVCAQGQTCVNGSCEGGAACTSQEISALQACFAQCGGDLTCPQLCLGQVSGTCAQAVTSVGLCATSSGCPTNSASDLLSLCVYQSCSNEWQNAFGDFQPGCPSGQTECSGQCVDLNSDEANCGQCGSACPFSQVCNNGSCQTQCAPGETVCNGQCINNQTDPNHCGGCNVACRSGEVCNNGTCEAGNSCIPGAPCNADSNGCTQDICDSSGTCVVGTPVSCDDGLSCTQDSCVSTGNNTYTCDFQLVGSNTICSGQCVDTNSDPSNCGGCNVACSAGQSCNNGVCQTNQGSSCQSSADCGGGPCVDGVCCSSACNSTCEACTQSKTGLPNGTCAPVVAHTDPDNECGPSASCSGAGSCALVDGSVCFSGLDCLSGSCNNNVCSPGGVDCGGASLTQSCTVDGSSCSGTQSRTCTNDQLSAWGACISDDPNCAPVDCQVSNWSAWSACSATCGGGTQTRTRTVLVQPENGGQSCPALSETQACNTQNCSNVGNACQTSADCGGGPCVDGICCSSACNVSCEACAKRLTGAADGTCAPITLATDPDNECPNGACNGSGSCALFDGQLCFSSFECLSGSCNNNVCGPVTCPSGQTECSGQCVDLTADKNNCGACGNACPLGTSCFNGFCR